MSHYCSCMQGWSWRGWRGAAWWDSAGVWKVWQGGKCCHLPGKSIDGEKTKVVALTFNPNPSFFRKNKMTPMTLRCMSKFLWSSTRALRQKRPRMDLMEGKRFLFCTLFKWIFSDFSAVGQCLLWSMIKRCMISKISQPRQHCLFSISRTFLNYGKVLNSLESKSWKTIV